MGGAAAADRDRGDTCLRAAPAAGADAGGSAGLVCGQGCFDHVVFHAPQVGDSPDALAPGGLGHRLFRADVAVLFSGCVPHRAAGSEMTRKLATAMLFLVLWSAPALAQGCAMCYSNAAGTTKDGQRAISKGVLILLVPPLT